MIGGEKHAKESRRAPKPVFEWDVAGLERASIDDVAGHQRGQYANDENDSEEYVAKEKFRDAQSGVGLSGGGGAKGEVILARHFDSENGEDHGVGIVDVEHEAGDQGENCPLSESARGERLVPIPEEKRNDESGMRVGPGRIEVHVNG